MTGKGSAAHLAKACKEATVMEVQLMERADDAPDEIWVGSEADLVKVLEFMEAVSQHPCRFDIKRCPDAPPEREFVAYPLTDEADDDDEAIA